MKSPAAALPSRCARCQALLRPNVLMFGDWGWLGQRTAAQRQRLEAWLGGTRRAVVIEIGAGLHVPTVRWFSENLGEPLIRINPTEPDIPGRGVSFAPGRPGRAPGHPAGTGTTRFLRALIAVSRGNISHGPIVPVTPAGTFFAGLVDAVVGGGGLIQIPLLSVPNTAPATLFGYQQTNSVVGTTSAAIHYGRRIAFRGESSPGCRSGNHWLWLGARAVVSVPPAA